VAEALVDTGQAAYWAVAAAGKVRDMDLSKVDMAPADMAPVDGEAVAVVVAVAVAAAVAAGTGVRGARSSTPDSD